MQSSDDTALLWLRRIIHPCCHVPHGPGCLNGNCLSNSIYSGSFSPFSVYRLECMLTNEFLFEFPPLILCFDTWENFTVVSVYV